MSLRTDVAYVDGAGRLTQAGWQALTRELADLAAGLPIVTGDAPIYACRAWVNFNGTGVVAIRSSGNVSSITDGGVGIYTVNFTTAMPDANHAPVATCRDDPGFGGGNAVVSSTAAGNVAIFTLRPNTTVLFDPTIVTAAIFR